MVLSEARRDQGCQRNGAGESGAPIPGAGPTCRRDAKPWARGSLSGSAVAVIGFPMGGDGLPVVC